MKILLARSLISQKIPKTTTSILKEIPAKVPKKGYPIQLKFSVLPKADTITIMKHISKCDYKKDVITILTNLK